MRIIDNPDINIGLPGGSFSGLDEFKLDLLDLVVINIEKEKEGLRIDVRHKNNKWHSWVRAKNQKGKNLLEEILNNKEKFIGRLLENIEI